MRLLRFFGIWAVLLAMAKGASTAGTPDFVQILEDDGSASRFSFRVQTPALSLSPGPAGFRIELGGFGALALRPGAPEIPTHTFRIALPPGAEPVLRISNVVEDRVPGVRPRAVPRIVADVPPEPKDEDRAAVRDGLRRDVVRREIRVEDPAVYDAAATYPASIARVSNVGVFRGQRFAEVEIAPVRWDPGSRALRVARSFDVTVEFAGDDGVRSAPAPDPKLEEVYRESFLNYGQGTTFRQSTTEPVAAPSLAPQAGAPVYEIRVRKAGTVRIDQARVAGTGLDAQALSSWKVTNRGVEVPLQVFDADSDDTLDAGDWVQFWGQALDDEPKTVLNADLAGTDGDIFEYRDFTDENVYVFTAEAGPRARMATRDAAPTNVRTPPGDFEAVAHKEVDSPDGWRPLGGADPWYWTPSLTSTSSITEQVALPGLASTTAPLHVLVNLRGLTENANLTPDHHTRVTLQNGSAQTLQANDDNGTFDGRVLYLHDFTWTFPGSGPTASDPVGVVVEARPITSGSHQIIRDWIEVRYRRTFQAAGDALTFDWPDGDAEFVVSGLATSAATIYEITGRIGGSGVMNPVRLTAPAVTGAGPFSARFRVDNDPSLTDGTPRRFVVFGNGGVTVPANPDFTLDATSDLRDTSIQADLIVIAHPTILGALSQATLNQLLSWRSANQGITSKVAMIGDVEDEFGDHLPGPQAIKNFLTWVMSTAPGEGWAAPKPAYVLILGDSSYDYKAGTANGTFVPTQIMFKDDPSFGYYASDSILATSGTSRVPNLVVGRIPARSDAECDGVLAKELAYEQAPPTGTWRANALVVSDRGKNFNSNEAADFETTNASAIGFMKRPPHTARNLRYWSDYCGGQASGCTPSAANAIRADIKASINGTDGTADGTSIIQYVGHGNFDVWSDDAFFDNRSPVFDTDDLVNGNRQPVLIVHNCLTGGFMGTALRTLGEDFSKKADGGAIAVFSPSGLTSGYLGQRIGDSIWGDFFGNKKVRDVSVAILNVQTDLCSNNAYDACQNYVLLGDPSTRTVLPTVNPPTNVVATAGNAQVSLSWTASTTPSVTYDVYHKRTDQGNGYQKVGSTSVAAFTDPGLANAKTYQYYVVALDAQGFESRWSNFNSDCNVSGPDCVQATPLNPNPPNPPTGLVVTDPETGGKLNLTWNANSESDLDHYTVEYRKDAEATWTQRNVGKLTSDSLTGLENQTLYHVRVTATNTSSKTSSPSAEQTGTPTFVRGTRSPAFISSLRVDKSSANALLSWNAVTTDIYGKTETVSKYEIFRGTTPDFVPGAGNKIGETTGTSFTDTNALQPGGPNYHWLVRAVDVDGNPGGLGSQLPNGIDTMALAKSGTTPGNIVLSWPAVTTDFDGGKARIDHYELYGRSTPFRRDDVRNGTIPMVTSTTGTSIEITPPAGTMYYSLIVVDAKGNKSPF